SSGQAPSTCVPESASDGVARPKVAGLETFPQPAAAVGATGPMRAATTNAPSAIRRHTAPLRRAYEDLDDPAIPASLRESPSRADAATIHRRSSERNETSRVSRVQPRRLANRPYPLARV